jgi:hypothetical protein
MLELYTTKVIQCWMSEVIYTQNTDHVVTTRRMRVDHVLTASSTRPV